MKKVENRQEPRQAMGRQGRSLIPFAIAILVVLGLVFGGWGTVYAAQDTEPDDFLYPVKLVVEYLEDFNQVTVNPDDPSTIGERDGIQIHLWDRDQDMTHIDDNGVDWEGNLPPMNRYGQLSEEIVLDDQSTLLDETITTTPAITGTQWMTRTMNGNMWGPGPCFEDPENPEPCDLTAPHGYTYTHGVDGDAPFNGEPPVVNPDYPSGYGPAESPWTEAPVGNTGGQKKGK